MSLHSSKFPVLSPDEVHIWCLSLDETRNLALVLKDLLSEDELARAERFRFESDRRRFIISRGVLRELLGKYLAIEPTLLSFIYTQYGKPVLKSTNRLKQLKFNLSHSHDIILIAMTWDKDLGIDIEHCRAIDNMDGIARRYFSHQEYQTLLSVPDSYKRVAFYNCWTRKEAFLKAVGKGLSLPIEQFDVSLKPWEPAKLLAIRSKGLNISDWTIKAMLVDPDYVAALVVRGHNLRMMFWQYLRV